MKQELKETIFKDTRNASVILILMSFFVFFVNPNSIALLFVLFMPLLMALFFFYSLRIALVLFAQLDTQKAKRVSQVLASGVLVVVMLGSLKQLAFQDLLLAFLLFGGLAFYFSRNRSQSQEVIA